MYLLGLLCLLVFAATLILVASSVKRLSRTALDLGFASSASVSHLAWTSRLLAAVSLLPAIITALAYIAAIFWDDQLVLRLGSVATVAAFVGILAVIASSALLILPNTQRAIPKGSLRKVVSVNFVGLVSCIVVIRIFWQWFPHW